MRVRIGCELAWDSPSPTAMLVLVRPRERDAHWLLEETREVSPPIPIRPFIDGFGNHVWRFTAPPGALRLRYDALAEVLPLPDPPVRHLPGTDAEAIPDDVLLYTIPSRYCPSDLIVDEAWERFGATADGGARVQAVCDWVHANIAYEKGSTATTSGLEAYRQRRGVCRDFAHIGVMLCRALNIPARYVCGYLPEIAVPLDPSPMDFHAWFEVYLGGAWRTCDARHNQPRVGRVLIGRGRDAVDVAFTTSFGGSRLGSLQVWAEESTA